MVQEWGKFSSQPFECTRIDGNHLWVMDVYRVDVKGDSAEAKGYRVDVKGDSAEAKGYRVDVKGDSAEAKGYRVDVKGDSADAKGYIVAVKDRPREAGPPSCPARGALCPVDHPYQDPLLLKKRNNKTITRVECVMLMCRCQLLAHRPPSPIKGDAEYTCASCV
eukprot:1195188-Prorocentrum_minimum.AAC.3